MREMDAVLPTDEETIAQQLVERILAKDTQAESELVQRYGQGLYTVLLNESKDENLAKDIAQESWEFLLSNIRNDKIRNPKRLGAIQTAKYRLLMHYRKQGSRRYESDEKLSEKADQSQSPHNSYFRIQQGNKIDHVLSKMIKRDASILRETYIKGTEKSKLLIILELSSENFDRVLYRARQRFRKIWFEEYGDED